MENLITIDMIDDWAGAAMQALVSCRGRDKDFDISQAVALSYEIASEMAAARGAFLEAHGDDLAESESESDSDE
jgi:hypothetical protein